MPQGSEHLVSQPGCSLKDNPMKIFEKSFVFDNDWATVTAAFWAKYPNELQPHVLRVDTLAVDVDPLQQAFTTRRLHSLRYSVPRWMERFFGGASPEGFGLEDAYCSLPQKVLRLKSRNYTFSSFICVDEECTYTPHPTDPSKTLYTQTAAYRVFGLGALINKALERAAIQSAEEKSALGFAAVQKQASALQQQPQHQCGGRCCCWNSCLQSLEAAASQAKQQCRGFVRQVEASLHLTSPEHAEQQLQQQQNRTQHLLLQQEQQHQEERQEPQQRQEQQLQHANLRGESKQQGVAAPSLHSKSEPSKFAVASAGAAAVTGLDTASAAVRANDTALPADAGVAASAVSERSTDAAAAEWGDSDARLAPSLCFAACALSTAAKPFLLMRLTPPFRVPEQYQTSSDSSDSSSRSCEQSPTAAASPPVASPAAAAGLSSMSFLSTLIPLPRGTRAVAAASGARKRSAPTHSQSTASTGAGENCSSPVVAGQQAAASPPAPLSRTTNISGSNGDSRDSNSSSAVPSSAGSSHSSSTASSSAGKLPREESGQERQQQELPFADVDCPCRQVTPLGRRPRPLGSADNEDGMQSQRPVDQQQQHPLHQGVLWQHLQHQEQQRRVPYQELLLDQQARRRQQPCRREEKSKEEQQQRVEQQPLFQQQLRRDEQRWRRQAERTGERPASTASTTMQLQSSSAAIKAAAESRPLQFQPPYPVLFPTLWRQLRQPTSRPSASSQR